MKNGVEFFVPELRVPIEGRQVLCHEIAAISDEIFEFARAKIVDHSEMRIREFFLQRKREIRSDETGATSNDEIEGRVQFLGKTKIRER